MADTTVNADINFRLNTQSIKPALNSLQSELRNATVTIPVHFNVDQTSLKNLQSQNGSFQALTTTLNGLSVAANKASVSMSTLGKAISNLGASTNAVKALNDQLKNSNVAINNVGNSVKTTGQALNTTSKEAQSFAESIGISTKRFASFSVAAAAISSVVYEFSNAVKAAIEFDAEMVKFKQVGDDTPGVINNISQSISRLSTTLGVSSKDLSETSVTLRQAQLSANETKIALEAIAKTTVAPTFKDIKNTTEGAIAILHTFKQGVGALEAQFSSINKVAADFATESTDLIENVRRAGSAFKSAGGSLEELHAVFTAVRSTTRLSSETISAGLNTIFARLERPTTLNALHSLNIDLLDTKGNAISGLAAIEKLYNALKNEPPGSTKTSQVVEEIAGTRQRKVAIPLITEFPLALEVYKTALDGTDSLNKNVEEGVKSLQRKLMILKETFLDLFRTLASNSTLQTFLSLAINLTTTVTKLAKAFEPLIPILAGAALFKAASGSVGFLGKFAEGFGKRTFVEGGVIPEASTGIRGRDRIPILAEPGEFIITKQAAQNIGYKTLHEANQSAGTKFGNRSNGIWDAATGTITKMAFANGGRIPSIPNNVTPIPPKTLPAEGSELKFVDGGEIPQFKHHKGLSQKFSLTDSIPKIKYAQGGKVGGNFSSETNFGGKENILSRPAVEKFASGGKVKGKFSTESTFGGKENLLDRSPIKRFANGGQVAVESTFGGKKNALHRPFNEKFAKGGVVEPPKTNDRIPMVGFIHGGKINRETTFGGKENVLSRAKLKFGTGGKIPTLEEIQRLIAGQSGPYGDERLLSRDAYNVVHKKYPGLSFEKFAETIHSTPEGRSLTGSFDLVGGKGGVGLDPKKLERSTMSYLSTSSNYIRAGQPKTNPTTVEGSLASKIENTITPQEEVSPAIKSKTDLYQPQENTKQVKSQKVELQKLYQEYQKEKSRIRQESFKEIKNTEATSISYEKSQSIKKLSNVENKYNLNQPKEISNETSPLTKVAAAGIRVGFDPKVQANVNEIRRERPEPLDINLVERENLIAKAENARKEARQSRVTTDFPKPNARTVKRPVETPQIQPTQTVPEVANPANVSPQINIPNFQANTVDKEAKLGSLSKRVKKTPQTPIADISQQPPEQISPTVSAIQNQASITPPVVTSSAPQPHGTVSTPNVTPAAGLKSIQSVTSGANLTAANANYQGQPKYNELLTQSLHNRALDVEPSNVRSFGPSRSQIPTVNPTRIAPTQNIPTTQSNVTPAAGLKSIQSITSVANLTAANTSYQGQPKHNELLTKALYDRGTGVEPSNARPFGPSRQPITETKSIVNPVSSPIIPNTNQVAPTQNIPTTHFHPKFPYSARSKISGNIPPITPPIPPTPPITPTSPAGDLPPNNQPKFVQRDLPKFFPENQQNFVNPVVQPPPKFPVNPQEVSAQTASVNRNPLAGQQSFLFAGGQLNNQARHAQELLPLQKATSSAPFNPPPIKPGYQGEPVDNPKLRRALHIGTENVEPSKLRSVLPLSPTIKPFLPTLVPPINPKRPEALLIQPGNPDRPEPVRNFDGISQTITKRNLKAAPIDYSRKLTKTEESEVDRLIKEEGFKRSQATAAVYNKSAKTNTVSNRVGIAPGNVINTTQKLDEQGYTRTGLFPEKLPEGFIGPANLTSKPLPKVKQVPLDAISSTIRDQGVPTESQIARNPYRRQPEVKPLNPVSAAKPTFQRIDSVDKKIADLTKSATALVDKVDTTVIKSIDERIAAHKKATKNINLNSLESRKVKKPIANAADLLSEPTLTDTERFSRNSRTARDQNIPAGTSNIANYDRNRQKIVGKQSPQQRIENQLGLNESQDRNIEKLQKERDFVEGKKLGHTKDLIKKGFSPEDAKSTIDKRRELLQKTTDEHFNNASGFRQSETGYAKNITANTRISEKDILGGKLNAKQRASLATANRNVSQQEEFISKFPPEPTESVNLGKRRKYEPPNGPGGGGPPEPPVFKSPTNRIAERRFGPEKAPLPQNSAFRSLAGKALGATILGAAYVAPQFIEKGLGTAEEPGPYGKTGAKVGAVAGGLLSGTAIGGAIGLQTAGAPGAVIGAFIGGLTSAVGALDSFDKALESAEINKFAKDLNNTNIDTKTGTFTTFEDQAKFQKHIDEILPNKEDILGSDTVRNSIVGRKAKSVEELQNKSPALLAGAITEKIGAEKAKALSGEAFSRIQAIQKENPDKNLNTIIANLGAVSEKFKGVDISILLGLDPDRKEKLKREDVARQEGILVAKKLNAAISQTADDFEKISKKFTDFTQQLEKAGETFSQSLNITNTQGSALLSGKVTGPAFTPNVSLLGPTGKELENFGKAGGGFDQNKEIIRSVLETVTKSADSQELTADEKDSQSVEAGKLYAKKIKENRGQVYARSAGTPEDIAKLENKELTPTEKTIQKQLTLQIQEAGLKQGDLATKEGYAALSERVLAPQKPIVQEREKGNAVLQKVFSEQQKANVEHLDTGFGLSQKRVSLTEQESQNKIEGLNRGAQIEPLTTFGFNRRGAAVQAFAPEEIANRKKAVQTDLSQKKQLTELTGFENNSVTSLTRGLQGRQRVLASTQKQLSQIQDKGTIGVGKEERTATAEDAKKLANTFSETQDGIRRFSTALQKIAESTDKVSIAQEKYQQALAKRDNDLNARKSIAEIATFGSQEEKAQFAYKENLTQQAVQAGPKAFQYQATDEEKRTVYEHLQNTKGLERQRYNVDNLGRIDKKNPTVLESGQNTIDRFSRENLNILTSNPDRDYGNFRPRKGSKHHYQRTDLPDVGLRNNGRLQNNVEEASKEIDKLQNDRQVAGKALTGQQEKQNEVAGKLNEQAFKDFTVNFNKTVQDQVNGLLNFANTTKELVAALKEFSFPKEITIKRDGVVQVVLNGTEALSRVKGDLQTYVGEEIQKQFKDQFDKAFAEKKSV